MRCSIPLSSPHLTADDIHGAIEVLQGSWLSLGPKLPAFERAVCDFVGSRFAVAVNSGTSGLHLCMKAADIHDGNEVITTPFSFIASANAILFERGIPVFVDIDPVTYNMDVSRIEEVITPRTRAILPVHVFGRPCLMGEILDVAARHRLTVIEDACEAIGARVGGKPVGSLGQAGVFAFYPNKQMTTGEGGAIVTDDQNTANLCRSWRNQGRGKDGSWLQHERLGYNYRLSDISCALGISQLRRLPGMLAARAHVAAQYRELLYDVREVIIPPPLEPAAEISWFVYVVRLQNEYTREDRDLVLEKLRSRAIGCSSYFTPIHLQPFYREMFGFQPGDFPMTERVAERTIALPFFNQLSESQIQYVSESLRQIVASLKPRRFLSAAGL